MMVYFASPYTHTDKAVMYCREIMISRIAAMLVLKHGVTPYLPITQSHRMNELMPGKFGTSFTAWKDIDLDAIDHCDEVWVITLPGWKESVGVQAEIEHAKKKKISVKYVNYKTLKFIKGHNAVHT